MNDEAAEKILYKMFDVLLCVANLESPTDDDAWMVVDNLPTIPNLFEEYIKAQNIKNYTRTETEGCISFGNGMVCIGFAKNRDCLPKFDDGSIQTCFVIETCLY